MCKTFEVKEPEQKEVGVDKVPWRTTKKVSFSVRGEELEVFSRK